MGDTRVINLVGEVIDSGRTPEDVCVGCPELLPEVRKRLDEYRDLEQRLDVFFPGGGTAPMASAVEPAIPELAGYRVRSVLGAGGMGVVYLGRHLRLERDVAIKMLARGPHATDVERARFLREARALATLRHPNIVSVFDVGESEGRPYFTMEHMDGGTLAAALANQPQTHGEAARVTRTLADAVEYAHRHGIVHRDLKPANILVGADASLKISDFGIARTAHADHTLTSDGARMGTPSYMSPEQAAGRMGEVGPASDVYALGAILYELLTGRPPFRGSTPAETERQVLQEDPAPPRVLNSAVPRDLETICLKCLQKAPGRRYAAAGELADDLRRFERGEPIRARPTGKIERAVKWLRRRPGAAAAWASSIAAVGSLLGAALWTASQHAAIDRAVAEDLAEAVRLEEASEWRIARDMLERAKTRLAAGPGNARLTRQADAIDREFQLVDKLIAMRYTLAASKGLEFDLAKWWEAYDVAFREAGLLREGDTPELFATRVTASSVRAALISAMDSWSISATDLDKHRWLLHATRLADPDPVWRDRVRDAMVLRDSESVVKLARDADLKREPVTLLLIVAGRYLDFGGDEAMAFMRRVQAANPSDFWANFALGETLMMRGDREAVAFFHAAIAVRPQAAAAHVNLATSLYEQQRMGEAIDAMRRAVELDPGSKVAQYNLAMFYFREGKLAEAVGHAVAAATIDPDDYVMHALVGSTFIRLKRYAEAIPSFRRAAERCRKGTNDGRRTRGRSRRAKRGLASSRCRGTVDRGRAGRG